MRRADHGGLRLVFNFEGGARLDEGGGGGELALDDGVPQRALELVVDRVNVRALFDRQLHERLLGAVRRHPVQRRHVVLVARAERRAGVDEDAGALEGARLARQQQRRAQLPVLHAHLRLRRQQRLHSVP